MATNNDQNELQSLQNYLAMLEQQGPGITGERKINGMSASDIRSKIATIQNRIRAQGGTDASGSSTSTPISYSANVTPSVANLTNSALAQQQAGTAGNQAIVQEIAQREADREAGVRSEYEKFYNNTTQDYQNAFDAYGRDMSGLAGNASDQYLIGRSDIANQYGNIGRETGDRYQNLGANVGGMYNALGQNLSRDMQAGQSELLAGYGSSRENVLRELEGIGQQEAADIREGWRKNSETQSAALRNRGLSGSTVGMTMRQGNEREQNADLARLNERLRGERAGVMQDYDTLRLAAQESTNRDRYATSSEIGQNAALSAQNIGLTGEQEQSLVARQGVQADAALMQNSINDNLRLRELGIQGQNDIRSQAIRDREAIYGTALNELAKGYDDVTKFVMDQNYGYPDINSAAAIAQQYGQAGGGSSAPVSNYVQRTYTPNQSNTTLSPVSTGTQAASGIKLNPAPTTSGNTTPASQTRPSVGGEGFQPSSTGTGGGVGGYGTTSPSGGGYIVGPNGAGVIDNSSGVTMVNPETMSPIKLKTRGNFTPTRRKPISAYGG